MEDPVKHLLILRLATVTGSALGKVSVPIFILLTFPFIYGLWNMFDAGLLGYRLVPLIGPVVCFVILWAYGFSDDLRAHGYRWSAAICGALTPVPYLFVSLYIVSFLGGSRLYRLTQSFSVGGLGDGILWVLDGLALIAMIGTYIEIVDTSREIRKKVFTGSSDAAEVAVAGFAYASRATVWVPWFLWYFKRGPLTLLTGPLFLFLVYCIGLTAFSAIVQGLALFRVSAVIFGFIGAFLALVIGWIPVFLPPVLYYSIAKSLPGLWLRPDTSTRHKILVSVAWLVLTPLAAYLIQYAVSLGVGWIADRDPCAAFAAGVTGSRLPINCR